MLRSLFIMSLAGAALILTACVTTFDGVFTNPCSEALSVEAHYGDSDAYRAGERHLIIETEVEARGVTRLTQAFEDPEAEPFTVVVEEDRALIEVDGENRRDAAPGEILVVIPAEACDG